MKGAGVGSSGPHPLPEGSVSPIWPDQALAVIPYTLITWPFLVKSFFWLSFESPQLLIFVR